MKNKSINYYGYEKNTYDDCASLITQMNRRHMEILNVWFILITAIYLFFSWQNSYGFKERDLPYFLGFLIGEIVFEMILVQFRSFSDRYGSVFMTVNMAAVLAFGMVCSSTQPFMAATVYLVILVLVALSYISTMVRMTALLVAACAVFLFISHKVKPSSIYHLDVFNVLVVLLLSEVLHYTFQRARIRQFITFRQSARMQQELEIKSSYDALTSLLNRGRFFSMGAEIMRQERNDHVILGLVDLDKFKQINDTLGHQMGDKVIQTAGKTILETLNIDYGEKWSFTERAIKEKKNFAGRLGGDEFVVLVRNLQSKEETVELFERILKALNSADLDGIDGIQASIGVTEIGPSEKDMDKAYARADEALYNSKESGRNRISYIKGDETGGLL